MSDSPTPPSAPRHHSLTIPRRFWLPAVLILTFLAYAPSLANGFAMDDLQFAMGHGITRNYMVAEFQPLTRYFTSHYFEGTGGSSEHYRPITVISFALRHALFGDAPFPAHLANVLLMVLSTYLVVRLAVAAGASYAGACIGGLLFGLHAIHSEAVANIVGRGELLGFVFGAGACLVFFESQAAAGRRRVGVALAAAALFFLGFCSKEGAVCWAPFLAVLCWARSRPGSLAEILSPANVRAALVPIAPLLLYFVLREHALAKVATETNPTIDYVRNPLYFEHGFARVATATMIWGYGLWLTLFPFHLACDYGYAVFPIVRSVSQPAALWAGAAGVVLVAVLWIGLANHRRRPLLFCACCGFLGFSFLVSNLPVPIATIFGERTYFGPSMCIALLAACVTDGLARTPRAVLRARLAGIAALVWLVASTATLLDRNPVWNDDTSLFLTDAINQPRSVRVRTAAGVVLHRHGNISGAKAQWQAATEIDPGFADAWNNLGVAHLNLGHPESARAVLMRALEARPASLERLADDIYVNLMFADLRLDRPEEALDYLDKAIAAAAKSVVARRDVRDAVLRAARNEELAANVRARAARTVARYWPRAAKVASQASGDPGH